MIALTGRIIQEIRDYVPVQNITARVRGGEPASGDAPPMVIVVKAGSSRAPFGQGSGSLGLQDVLFYARCYGATRIQAEQLAGAVSDSIHERGPRIDSQGRLIHLSLDEGGGGSEVDPDTRWPLEVLTIRAIGAAHAVGAGAAPSVGGVPQGGGGADSYFVHYQTIPAAVWTITHNLNKHPSVSVEDGSGEIFGDIDWINDNVLTITFAGPVAGRADLN